MYSGLPGRPRRSLNGVTESMTPKLWSSFSLMVCTALLYGFCTIMALDLKDSTLDPITGTVTLRCPTPGSKLIVYSAEFSPASERFCDRLTCRSHNGANTTDCRLAHGGATGRTICNRKFSVKDVWRLYEWCRDNVTEGKPCHLRDLDGLSQGGAYLVRYYCVEDIPPPDPCSFVRHSDSNDLFHDLSSSTFRRQCTCTGSVRFREASDWESILLHISYLIMVDPMSPLSSSSSSSPSRESLRATVTSEKNEEKLNASSTPDFLLVMVTHKSPVFVFALQIDRSERLLGFVWLHVRDREVNISCTSSKEFTMVGISTSTPAVLSSANSSINNSGPNWLTLSAVAAAGGAFAVLIILATLIIVLKRNRSRRTSAQSRPPAAGTGGERAHTRPSNSAYEEVDQFSRRNHPDQRHPYHHHRHNLSSSHTYTSVHVPKPLTGCDVNDYARLQHGHEENSAAPSGSKRVPDNYDHMMRGRGDYIMLARESPRQEVIDNEYDHAGWNA